MKPVDYRRLRFRNLTSPEFRHLWLLLYWPIYRLAFQTLERLTERHYHPVFCELDRYIPFCEFFIVPYWFWFAFILWIMVYSFFFDVPAFKKFSYFVMITYSLTCLIYIVYPTMQELRPTEFARDNLFTDLVKSHYAFDTNTNVCPSIHVLGSMAVMFTAWHSERYRTVLWRTAFVGMTVLICASTLFLRQHSVIDIVLGLLLSFVTYPLVWRKKKPTPEVPTEDAKEAVHS